MISANDQKAKEEALTKKQKAKKKAERKKLREAMLVGAAAMAGEKTRPVCSMPLTKCPTHGYIHGAEAEELRSGIEELIARDLDGFLGISKLTDLLDRVDARDSCAFSEAFGFARARKK